MTQEGETPVGHPPSGGDLAGEYALGLLEGRERVEFEARLAQDSGLRQDVARWQEHFAALGMEVEEVTPPASVFAHLKRELWGENTLPWHRRIRIWEYAIGGVAAALVAFAVYNYSDFSADAPGVLSAQITTDENSLQVALALNEGTDLLRVEYSGAQPSDGRSYELWAIAEGATPVSLGVLPIERVAVLKLNAVQSQLLRVGVTLALSDEPFGGSPTGAPTGAVLGAGQVQLLTQS